jgi:SAM-dependent methyltransferase
VVEEKFQYVGSELSVFADAIVWKEYLLRQMKPFLRGRVAEVGAGLGTTTAVLTRSGYSNWLALEPDAALASQIPETDRIRVFRGTLSDLPADRLFDAILYVDVLEHIEDDSAEVKLAASHLAAGGHLVVLAPAHNFLFSPFDAAIGHFRRYDKAMLRAFGVPDLKLERLRYLDCVGFFASVANRVLLQQSMPGKSQIRFWDRVLVRLSKVLDPCLGYVFGKSILAVWSKGP